MEKDFKFGETLMRLRRGKLLSQQELADRCGRSSNYISDLERGVRQPSPSTFFIIAEALDLVPSELLTECVIIQKRYSNNQTERNRFYKIRKERRNESSYSEINFLDQ